MKATGVNSYTKGKLKALMAEGYNAEEISDMTQVEVKSVRNWMEHFADKVKVEEKKEDKPGEEPKTLKEKLLGK